MFDADKGAIEIASVRCFKIYKQNCLLFLVHQCTMGWKKIPVIDIPACYVTSGEKMLYVMEVMGVA